MEHTKRTSGYLRPVVFLAVALAVFGPGQAAEPAKAPSGDVTADGVVNSADLQCELLVFEGLTSGVSCTGPDGCQASQVCRAGFDADKVCLPGCLGETVSFGDSGVCLDPQEDSPECLGQVLRANIDLNCDGQITSSDLNFLVAIIMGKDSGEGTIDYDGDGQLNFCDADSDGDGHTAAKDCDDLNDKTYPSGAEVCDGKDNDCDGLLDNKDPGLVLAPCEKQMGVCSGAKKPADLCVGGVWSQCRKQDYLANHPDYKVIERCCDNLDNDCDGLVDTEDPDFPCGNGICDVDYNETCANCHQDCGACTESCCLEHSTAGCADPLVQSCVCALDPFCCYAQWDWVCAAESDGCESCNGNCCAVKPTPGCDTESIEVCVCAEHPECCDISWSGECVNWVTSMDCGYCDPAPICGDDECNGDETCNSCPADCGSCCGNAACDVGFAESCASCPEDCGPCKGACCAPNPTVGCHDGVVQECVCDVVPACCKGVWTATCAAAADSCDSCGGNCCQDNDSPGCADEGVESCVCETDPFCCLVVWDTLCAAEVATLACADCATDPLCGDGTCNGNETLAVCPEDCLVHCGNALCDTQYGETCLLCPDDCGECPNDCCSPHSAAGCDSQVTEACVCSKMPGCCEESWSGDCALAVELLGCGSCDPLSTCGDGLCQPTLFETCVSCADDCGVCEDSCCISHDTIGCIDLEAQGCVCSQLPQCCTEQWSDECAQLSDGCGTCKGDCCAGNGTPGCDDETVETCVCQASPYCCLIEWSQECSTLAVALGCANCGTLLDCGDGNCGEDGGENCVNCPGDCGDCKGSCCTAHDNFGCAEQTVQTCVCAATPSCCTQQWDEACAAKSDECGSCNGACCQTNDTPGCDSEPVEACVCGEDPYCCVFEWDLICVSEIATFGCGECN